MADLRITGCAGAVNDREALLRAEQSRKALEQKAVRCQLAGCLWSLPEGLACMSLPCLKSPSFLLSARCSPDAKCADLCNASARMKLALSPCS